MTSSSRGFSLAELTMALAITVGIGTIIFQLFHRNERIFRDQNLIIEMQQTARAVASQIADEVRMAGEGVPIYASTFDNNASEPVAAILATSTSSRLDFRAGLSNTETNVTASPPIELTLGASQTLAVGNGSLFATALGTSTPVGRFVFIWGPAGNSAWAWVRAELANISPTNLTIVPRQSGDAGRSGDSIRFTQSPAVSLEEAISFRMSDSSVRRATASDAANQTNPTWSAANEIGRNFTSLGFAYYDEYDNVVTPGSLAARMSIARVDIRVTAQTSDPLSNGERPTYPLSLRVIPRNLRLR
ncbi:MAG: hypothetical protein HYU27_05565 [Acidobacteria bacterium]|nr:hypothetical protein [Acidobacteriota bacterium]